MPKDRKRFDPEEAIKALVAKGHEEDKLRAEYAAQQLSLGSCAARRTLRHTLEAATASEVANGKRVQRIAKNAVNVLKRAHWAGSVLVQDQAKLIDQVTQYWWQFLASPSAQRVDDDAEGADPETPETTTATEDPANPAEESVAQPPITDAEEF